MLIRLNLEVEYYNISPDISVLKDMVEHRGGSVLEEKELNNASCIVV